MSALLPTGSPKYRRLSFLGRGSFGCVLKCQSLEDGKTVAIKIIQRKGNYELQAKEEVAALKHLRSLDPDRCNLVRWFEEFTDKDHIYLVFEHLDISLYDFMKERGFQHLQLMTIRPIVQQLANALNYLKAAGIIHGDIKCENVMMLSHLQESPRVKIIDFGLARKVSAARVGSKLQSLYYRSPEIILSLPFTEAIDMWSLGCMAAFMYLGTPLYPGRSEYDMITYIVETQGQPPDNMLNHGLRTIKFFQKDNSWTLKTPEQFYRETGIQLMDNRRNKFTSLDDLQHFSAAGEETNNVTMFVVMLKGMLQLDGTKRMTPCQVLDHQFINCASSCSKMIDIDQNKKQTFDNRKTRSLQQPPTRTAKPIQLNPHDLNKRSDNDRKMFQKTSAGPSTSSCSSQTQSCSFPKVKRKMTHGKDSDSSHDKRSDNEKKIGRKWYAVEARSTCSSHRDSTHSLHVQANQRSSLAKDHRPSPRSSSSTWAERQAPIGLKRKSSDEGDVQPGKRTSGPWSDNGRKRFQKTSAGQSTSSCSSQTQSCSFPKVKRKMTHGKDSDSSHDKRSDNEKKIDRKWDAVEARSTCSSHRDSTHSLHVQANQRSSLSKDHRPSPRSSSSTWAERQAPIGLKRKSSDEGDVQPGKRTSGPWSDNGRKRFQNSAGQSTSSCSSSSKGLAKVVSADQTPSKGNGSSSYPCSTNTPKRPKAPTKPILTSDLKFRKKIQAIMKERKRHCQGSKRHAHCQK